MQPSAKQIGSVRLLEADLCCKLQFVRNDVLSEVIVERSSLYASLLALLECMATTADLGMLLHPRWGAKKHFATVSSTSLRLLEPLPHTCIDPWCATYS